MPGPVPFARYAQPGAENCVVCEEAQIIAREPYAPLQGWKAVIRPARHQLVPEGAGEKES